MTIEEEVLSVARQFLSRVSPSGPRDVMAICPFHIRADGRLEKNPSFALSLSTGLYFCHSCGARGGLRRLLGQILDNDHVVDLRYGGLIKAVQSNLPPPPSPLDPEVTCQDPLPEGTLGLFAWDHHPEQLTQKGFLPETLKTFEVGYDKWHNRITYPLRDWRGSLVGISGRNVDAHASRYKIYSKEYELWGLEARAAPNRRALLYNAHNVLAETYLNPTPPPVIVVEGFKACMWVHQAGFRNVVASLGDHLSWEQRWMLERLGSEIVLFYDGNQAGINAMAHVVQDWHQPVRIAAYPRIPAQPDDLTPAEVQHAVERALPGPIWRYT